MAWRAISARPLCEEFSYEVRVAMKDTLMLKAADGGDNPNARLMNSKRQALLKALVHFPAQLTLL